MRQVFQLAQINIAKALAPLDDPLLADFVADLDRINELAEQSKGFVWRLKDESNNAISINPFDDPLMIVNMSVWETVEDLKNFAYHTDHLAIFRKRAKWFERMRTPHMAMWWIPAGNYPDAEEGKRRIEFLENNGPSAKAFNFRKIFHPE